MIANTQASTANAYPLAASGPGASGSASGTLLFSPEEKIGVLYVRHLPTLDPNKVYQLWYLDDQGQTPRPGGTFTTDSDGNGFVAVAPDTPSFDGVALTAEPRGGSKAPTSAIVIQGRIDHTVG
jgi:anti-sigma-K factor RskA